MLGMKTHKSITFPVVSYGCEICVQTLRAEHTMGASENMALRVTRTEKDKIIGERKLFNKKPHNLYFFGKCHQNNQVKEGEISMACSTHERRLRAECMWDYGQEGVV
jgi:hypothetical protein